MSLDSYVTLGRSGLRVSPFCLGTMTFGEEWGFGTSPSDSATILASYLDQGGNFIDTANLYTNGHSEKIIGDFFSQQKERRHRSVIATKFFGNLHPQDPNGGSTGRKAIIEQCENSLRRLQTDYIDLYWMHNWDRTVPVEETMRALDDLVTSGKVRYIGMSDTPAWVVAQAQVSAHFRGWSPLIATQVEYSLLERTVEGELIPMSQELGLGVIPWSPLKNGWLSGKYTRANAETQVTGRAELLGLPSEKDYLVIDVLLDVAAELNATPAQTALAWVNQQAGVTSTLIGVRKIDQLHDNLKALNLQLSPSQLDALNQASQPTLNFPADMNRQMAPSLAFAGAKVDGVQTTAFPLLGDGSIRY